MPTTARLSAWVALTAVILTLPPLAAGGDASADEGKAALTLEAAADRTTVVSGDPIELVATFRATGPKPAHLYVPPYVPSTSFPTWRFTHADGRVFVPAQAAFQAGWILGLQGEIAALEPGTARAFPLRATHFVRRDAAPAGRDAGPLPVGTYDVRATYARDSSRLPYGLDDMRIEHRDHPEVFTGRLQSESIALTVTPSRRPVVTLDAPKHARPGQPYPLSIRIANESGEPLEPNAAIRVRVTSKAFGGGSATFVLVEGRPVVATPARPVTSLRLAPRAATDVTLDLTSVRYAQQRQGRLRMRGFHEMFGPSSLLIDVRLVDREGAPLAGASLWRSVADQEPDPATPLAVRIEVVETGTANPVVDVVVRNTSPRRVRLPARLGYPRHVFFSIVDAHRPETSAYRISGTVNSAFDAFSSDEPGSQARIAPDLAWDGDRFEPAPDLEQATLVDLPPGGELRRRFRLGDLIAGETGIEGRIVRVRAFFRNRSSGRHLGLEGVYTGLVASEPVEVRGRIW